MKSIKKTFTVTAKDSDDTHVFQNERQVTNFLLQSEGKYLIFESYEALEQSTSSYRATIIMPCWQAPMRTIRAIMSVFNQDTNGWQLIAIGDGCPNFANLIESDLFKELQSKAYLSGNEIIGLNTEHFGGYGYHQREMAKKLATGAWVMYLDNDDVLKTNHVSTRLSAAEHSQERLDLLYFNTWREDIQWHREAILEFGHVGHSEIMWRTEFLKTLPAVNGEYGHDWTQISQGLEKGAKTKKVVGETTYIIKSTPNKREGGID